MAKNLVTTPNTSYRITNASSDTHLIQLWLRSKSSNSIDAYSRDVKQFLDHVECRLSEIKIEHIWSWMDLLRDQGLAVSTISRKLASIKSLFSFAQKVGYLELNVGAAVSLPKVPDMLAQRILSESEAKAILQSATNARDRILLKLFYVTGARVSELASLKWIDCQERKSPGNMPEGVITLIGKGAKSRSVLVPASVWAALMEYREHELHNGFGTNKDAVMRSASGGGLSRSQIWRIVKKATKASGVDREVSPHWLRHAHASHSLDNGAPTHLVKETLGHQSLATTSRYTHARPDDSSGKYLEMDD
jgi:integrase/recombinase XerD